MLKRTKKDENSTPISVGDTLEEKPAPSSLGPTVGQERYSGEETTIIGERITIEGSIRGEENLVIEGAMKGTIEMGKHDFSIGPNGRVDGEIHAQNVSIDGLFKGTIKALGKVAVTKKADFNGEIKAKSFSVEDGAYFKGVVELDREAHKKSEATESPREPSSPEPAKQSVIPPNDVKMEK
ncbi:MAG: polymer-forming cytoskeletal protein [Deltaproteobacteria bacterium]|jgi:cytoskeletal protein CcmA (bactofilin family)|nr:polymer-forming cytoskeletal protein [Deltaproteobacteria bacterium]